MDERYHNLLSAGVEKKMRDLENEIMKDIVRRVKKAETITETADWQIQRLVILGNSTDDIRNLISKAVDGNEETIRQLYDEVIEREYTGMREIYMATGNSFIPYEENLELQQLVDAMVKQSTEELFNITKSTGFMVDMGGGRKVFTPLSEIYNNYLDDSITGMVSGAYDYNTLTRKLVNQMTSSGLRTNHQFSDGGRSYGVDYMSGWHNRIDVAARRALLTGFSQVAGQVTDMNARKLGTDYFEVSWHAGARPDHAIWQGRVYKREELSTVCGLGQGGGLLGWNCRHSYYPFIPGVSERQYSDEWLEQKAAEEAETTFWRGKEYNTYQATQRQRQLETSMRAQRERVQLLREAGADPDDITLAQCKYQALLQEYRAFSNKMKLPTQMERVYTGRTPGRISPSPKAYAAWQMEQLSKQIIKEKATAGNTKRVGTNVVDLDYISSEAFRRKFNKLTDNTAVNHSLRQAATAMLTHRNGTDGEDSYIFDSSTGNLIMRKMAQKDNLEVSFSQEESDMLRMHYSYKTIGIHNHPTNILPTGSDYAAAGYRRYEFGLVVTHDGRVFKYTAGNKPFLPQLMDNTVDKKTKAPYYKDILVAQLETIKEMKGVYGITWEEIE